MHLIYHLHSIQVVTFGLAQLLAWIDPLCGRDLSYVIVLLLLGFYELDHIDPSVKLILPIKTLIITLINSL